MRSASGYAAQNLDNQPASPLCVLPCHFYLSMWHGHVASQRGVAYWQPTAVPEAKVAGFLYGNLLPLDP
jgi:hypothetical protein